MANETPSYILLALVLALIVWVGYKLAALIAKLRGRTAQESGIRALEMSDIDNMDGHSFEHYVARLLRHEGYTEVEVTPGSGDFGVDIVASKSGHRYAIQVKRQARTVSRRAVSDAVAGRDYFSCDAAMVVTNNFLSKSAREFASSVGCEVVDRDILANWILRYQEGGPQQVSHSPETHADKTSLPPEEGPLGSASQPPSIVHPSSSDKSSVVPSEVLQSIKNMAASDYPNDFSTQADVVEEQIEAFGELAHYSPNGVPSEVLGNIRRQVEIDYASDFCTQLDVLKEQVESYFAYKQLSVRDMPPETLKAIMEEAARDYPDDYSTQLDVIDEQVEAYKRLRRLE